MIFLKYDSYFDLNLKNKRTCFLHLHLQPHWSVNRICLTLTYSQRKKIQQKSFRRKILHFPPKFKEKFRLGSSFVHEIIPCSTLGAEAQCWPIVNIMFLFCFTSISFPIENLNIKFISHMILVYQKRKFCQYAIDCLPQKQHITMFCISKRIAHQMISENHLQNYQKWQLYYELLFLVQS